LPVYGDGQNVRDWIHVDDHADALVAALERGRAGATYNIGAANEWTNLDIVHAILENLGKPRSLVRFVKDRPAHDRRYATDAAKARQELQWQPHQSFRDALSKTVAWYVANRKWWERLLGEEYRQYYRAQYDAREPA
jgi:dTDP-glucose 4,6-dehydratase